MVHDFNDYCPTISPSPGRAAAAPEGAMKTSVSLTTFPDGLPLADHLREVVRVADDTGIDTVWVADHLLQADPASTPDAPMLEALTTLGFLAACSRRVRLGSMVSPVHLRAPVLLIKAVTALDVLSGGRAWLGLGAGYAVAEAEATGVPLPPPVERYERLADTLELAHRMFAGDASPFAGRRITASGPVNRPLPVRRPPILVGGMGERRTLPLVARYADACNLFDIPDGGATVRAKLTRLRLLCEEAGRPYGSVEKTITTALAPGEDAASFAARCRALADLGVEHVVVITRGRPGDADAVATVAAAGGSS
jgi:alkanesulfonate monooxygenase SsuD/methylene tetrahydromethanopterin reductase-like flavin-dependent oxidoreductase (luciferase family)